MCSHCSASSVHIPPAPNALSNVVFFKPHRFCPYCGVKLLVEGSTCTCPDSVGTVVTPGISIIIGGGQINI